MNAGCVTGPRVVACLPAWQAESFIDRTLESLAAQTYPNLEVLISDDASTDRTAEVCMRLAAEHANFRFMRQIKRRGWIGNVNALLRAAEGEYLFFAFHDDPVAPTYVASLVEALERNRNAVLAFSDIQLDRSAMGMASGTREYKDLEGVTDRVVRACRLARMEGLWWIPNRGLFRADAAARIGGLRRHLAGDFSADWPWLLHLALLGEFVRVPEPLLHKIWRAEGVSRSWRGTPWQKTAVTLSCIREVRQARLPLAEQARVQSELLNFWAKRLWWHLRQA